MREDQLDDLELDGPIKLKILDGIAWGFTQTNDGCHERPRNLRLNLELLPSQPSRKSGNEERRRSICPHLLAKQTVITELIIKKFKKWQLINRKIKT